MPTTKGRILCTEDDADTRDLIKLVLETEGYQVVTTASTVDALELARTQFFDLYLVDSWMPGLSGPGLTMRLREFDIKTPILFYSGAAFESDRDSARIAGAQGYLVKPVDNDDLVAEVARLIAEAEIAATVALVVPADQ